MRQTQLFSRTRKEAPKDEVSKNAGLLIRAGYIHKEMAGVYSYLPLGLRVIEKIGTIIREEMNAIGGQEILLTVLQDRTHWEKSGRWDDKVVDNWFKSELKNGTRVGLGFSHEEEITSLMRDYIRSFRDLPTYPYQIQTKFRNEERAKSGIMRAREFLMKDLYSFSLDEAQHAKFYEETKTAYMRIFSRTGIGEHTYLTFASGGTFSKYSHEFQTLTSAGEDTIYICDKCKMAVNEEIKDEQKTCPGCGAIDLKKEKSVEVGNIFTLGTKFSDALDLGYVDEGGVKKPVFMGSYGIGLGRLMGTVVEVLADANGIVWPEAIAPFKLHLIALAPSVSKNREDGDSQQNPVKNYADYLYKKLVDAGVEVLYDDRDMRAGEKFADSDLIGIPYRAVVSEKMLAENKIEFKGRTTEKSEKIDEKELFRKIT
jgi:prolyl-tRNA synthetase